MRAVEATGWRRFADGLRRRRQVALPSGETALASAKAVNETIARAILGGSPLSLVRFGDTSGRVIANPPEHAPEWAYLQTFLGADVRREEVIELAKRLRRSAEDCDILGLRSDLLGPALPPRTGDPDRDNDPALIDRYPLRAVDRGALPTADLRRLVETRRAMEALRLSPRQLLTNAWVHVDMAEDGLIAAILRDSPSVAVVTSGFSQPLMARLAAELGDRFRWYQTPGYPWEEAPHGGNHRFLRDRFWAMFDQLRPLYRGEPFLVSTGIWSTPLVHQLKARGAVALNVGSLVDWLGGKVTRPAVAKTRFGQADSVPDHMQIAHQIRRTDRLEDFAQAGE